MVVADPAVSDIAPDAACEATVTVCTVTVAPVEVTVGVTVTDATLLGTVELTHQEICVAGQGLAAPGNPPRNMKSIMAFSGSWAPLRHANTAARYN